MLELDGIGGLGLICAGGLEFTGYRGFEWSGLEAWS